MRMICVIVFFVFSVSPASERPSLSVDVQKSPVELDATLSKTLYDRYGVEIHRIHSAMHTATESTAYCYLKFTGTIRGENFYGSCLIEIESQPNAYSIVKFYSIGQTSELDFFLSPRNTNNRLEKFIKKYCYEFKDSQ